MVKCLFCRIIRKELHAEVVYEDSHAIAVLDIHPRVPGHTMVIPKVHRETILDLKSSEHGPLFEAVARVTALVKRALTPDGFTIGINQGKASGQEIDHLHIHVLPRWRGDGGTSLHGVVDRGGAEPLPRMAEKIRAAGRDPAE